MSVLNLSDLDHLSQLGDAVQALPLPRKEFGFHIIVEDASEERIARLSWNEDDQEWDVLVGDDA